MAAVAAGRKDDWLALFAPDAIVQDPVGPSRLDPGGHAHPPLTRPPWLTGPGGSPAISRCQFPDAWKLPLIR